MVLNDKEIMALIDKSEAYNKKPLIENFKQENLQGATYDITMNKVIHVFKKGTTTIDLKETDSYKYIYEEIEIDEFGYVLDPGEYILITLNEALNLPDDVICEVLPKTKLIRAGLTILSQYCNPSYCGVLQLGIKNNSSNSIKIYPNFKIGQYIFKKLNSIPNNLYREKSDASYQDEKKFRGTKLSEDDISKGKKLLKKLKETLDGESL
ncbi:dCTP deaminase [Fusobacterium sp. MFO224]|uniref:dCTP deaminase n=1 Tax=Fusobacterium sp. MFO224 TaxID=3378070 RepID=UPI003851E63E